MLRVASRAMVMVCLCAVVVCEEQNESSNTSIEDFFGDGWRSVGRTFGHHVLKRLAFIFLPVMFTLGVISTLLLALTVISVKNLAIGVVLLIVGVSQAISRLLYTAAAVAPAPAPLLHYPHFHSRAEPSFAAPWPATAPAPLYSPWARSDDVGGTIEE